MISIQYWVDRLFLLLHPPLQFHSIFDGIAAVTAAAAAAEAAFATAAAGYTLESSNALSEYRAEVRQRRGVEGHM